MRALISIVGGSALAVLALGRTAAAQGSVSGQVSLLERPGERTEDLADVIVWLEPTGGTRVRMSPTITTIQVQGRQFSPRFRDVPGGTTVESFKADSCRQNVFSEAPHGARSTWVRRARDQTFAAAVSEALAG